MTTKSLQNPSEAIFVEDFERMLLLLLLLLLLMLVLSYIEMVLSKKIIHTRAPTARTARTMM